SECGRFGFSAGVAKRNWQSSHRQKSVSSFLNSVVMLLDWQSGQLRSIIGVAWCLLEKIERPPFRFLENARQVFADDTEENQLRPTDDHQRADERSPAADEIVHEDIAGKDVDEVDGSRHQQR